LNLRAGAGDISFPSAIAGRSLMVQFVATRLMRQVIARAIHGRHGDLTTTPKKQIPGIPTDDVAPAGMFRKTREDLHKTRGDLHKTRGGLHKTGEDLHLHHAGGNETARQAFRLKVLTPSHRYTTGTPPGMPQEPTVSLEISCALLPAESPVGQRPLANRILYIRDLEKGRCIQVLPQALLW